MGNSRQAVKVHIRKGDQVEIVTGREIGKRGKVLKVFPPKKRALIEGLNLIKRHTRPTQKSQQGGIVEKEGSINISNLMLVCSKCDKRTRVGYKRLEDNRKVRLCQRCGEEIG
jgi:large subunit ribosomal protein L24